MLLGQLGILRPTAVLAVVSYASLRDQLFSPTAYGSSNVSRDDSHNVISVPYRGRLHYDSARTIHCNPEALTEVRSVVVFVLLQEVPLPS